MHTPEETSMIWYEEGPAEPGEYYWRRDSASPIFTVEIREPLL